ncbi:MAG: nucleoside hydrolase [Candidatus Solibacter usitatus]|nr:nucleoside hydrolase [Candidatus Solibacter usitatus]
MGSRLIAAVLAAQLLTAASVRLIFDTDMGNDVDDALALAVIHALESRGEAKLLAVTLTKDNPWAAVYVDLVNHFYGRGSIPVGVVRNGKTPDDSKMIRLPAERRNPDGSLVYPRNIQSGADAPEAVALLRDILALEKDGDVVIVQVGFSTNLARLLEAAPDLVSRKVRLLSVMAGQFPAGKPEFNVRMDVPAFEKLVNEWPTPIVMSGFEIGLSILYPARGIEQDFSYVAHHPVADAYRNYQKMPYDRPAWDLTSVLQAVRPEGGYFSLSPKGKVRVTADGVTSFEARRNGRHQYLIAGEEQRKKALAALIELASRPPDRLR